MSERLLSVPVEWLEAVLYTHKGYPRAIQSDGADDFLRALLVVHYGPPSPVVDA